MAIRGPAPTSDKQGAHIAGRAFKGVFENGLADPPRPASTTAIRGEEPFSGFAALMQELALIHEISEGLRSTGSYLSAARQSIQPKDGHSRTALLLDKMAEQLVRAQASFRQLHDQLGDHPFRNDRAPAGRTIAGHEFEVTNECPVSKLRQCLMRVEALLLEKEELIQQQEIPRQEADHRFLNGLQLIVSLLLLPKPGIGER